MVYVLLNETETLKLQLLFRPDYVGMSNIARFLLQVDYWHCAGTFQLHLSNRRDLLHEKIFQDILIETIVLLFVR